MISKETLLKIFIALDDKSSKLPIGVPTIYRTPLSGSRVLWDDEDLIRIK